MRKWIVLVLLLLVLVLAAFYFLKPNNVSLKQTASVSFSSKAFVRGVMNEDSWQRWWPGEAKKKAAPSAFLYSGNKYRIVDKRLSSLVISISGETDSMLTELVLI